ncbi:MAG: hypothetical protein M1829_004642 [Trizodia sp. TS-e1964]|nr:MAG: hypothetical protein M1829_004642 [Trizodia sp. TS-e1964]
MYRSSLTLFCCPPGQFGVYDGEEAGKCVDECGGNHNPAANCKLASAFVRGEGPSVRRYRLPTPSHSSLLPRDGNVSPTPFDENVVAPYENSAISGGAIAGIVVGAVAVTALGGFTFLMIQRRKKRKQRERAIAANSAAFFGTAAPASATTETTHNPSQTDGTVLLKPTRPYKSDLDHEDMISVVDS